MYGFIKGVVANKPCSVQLELLNVQQDKSALLSSWNTGQTGLSDSSGTTPETETKDEWVKFEKPWLFFA
jgi:hypothetical protein